MTPTKPYLIRAIYEWINDNDLTPYLNIDTTIPSVMVPQQHIKNNSITLNIAATASHELLIDNEAITFKARFGGIAQNIYIPISAVAAIYAAENGQGMAFPKEEDQHLQDKVKVKPKKKPAMQLKVISGGKDQK